MSRAPRYAVIMAGGAGTRFWPRSRAAVPKQFLPITSERSMLQETVARVSPPIARDRVLIVTGVQHAALARRQIAGTGARLLVEPVGRNTAAAIVLAAVQIARRDPDATMIVLPADHAIPTLGPFRSDITLAAEVAERTHALVTIGIPPTHPETGFGYIDPGSAVPGHRGRVAVVRRFIEKPDAVRAKRLLAGGRVLWNAGIFAWRVADIVAAARAHVPDVLDPIEAAVRRGTQAALAKAYRAMRSVSIDYGVMEHADRVAVVRARFRWSDVGSWAAVEAFWRPAGAANASRGRVVAVDAEGCVVDSPSRLVALLGVRDLVVVDTPDAILVCPKSRAQDVRAIVDAVGHHAGASYL